MPHVFRYEEIAGELRQQILAGDFAEAAGRLPSERALRERYGVQRNTVRQALALLEAEGWVVTHPKRGSFASRPGEGVPDAPPSPAPSHLPAGTVLVVNTWNRISTAMDSLLRGLGGALAAAPLTLQRFDATPLAGQMTPRLPSPEYLRENNVVGVVLWPPTPTTPEVLTRLRAAAPLVLVDRRVPGFEADYVGFDDVAGGRLVTEHLLAQGHRRIGYLADETFAETVQRRWLGYIQAQEAAGVAPDPARQAFFYGTPRLLFHEYLRLFLDGGPGGEPLTAVVCSNDATAVTLFGYLQAEGRRVPGEIAVTGYGNLLPDYLDALALTTVAQPFEEVGRVAAEVLLRRLSQRAAAPDCWQIELPVRLIVRSSSAAPA